MIAYAARTGTRQNLAALRAAGWRLLVSAAGVLRTEGMPYALDNGAWSYHCHHRPFDTRAFASALQRLGGAADWTIVPDIVAGGLASLALSRQWLQAVLDACPYALLAVQDGMTPDDVAPLLGPRVGLFLGGSTAWKLTQMACWGRLATSIPCWYHVGRVNSARRIALCAAAGVTSFDGSSASRYRVTLLPLDRARKQLDLFGGPSYACPTPLD